MLNLGFGRSFLLRDVFIYLTLNRLCFLINFLIFMVLYSSAQEVHKPSMKFRREIPKVEKVML